MEKPVVFIEADREGYAPSQINSTMTVGELIDYLQQFNEDAQVFLSHDNGYTYGGITWGKISDDYIETEEDNE